MNFDNTNNKFKWMTEAEGYFTKNFSVESVAIVNTKGEFIPLENQSQRSSSEVVLSKEDAKRVKQEAKYLVHSHIVEDGEKLQHVRVPSLEDYEAIIEARCSGVILGIYEGAVIFRSAFGDEVLDHTLEGRSFQPGIYDCYSAVRSWIFQKKGVKLPDFARNFDIVYGKNPIDVIPEHVFEVATEIPLSEAKEGDILLCTDMFAKRTNGSIDHCAIFIDDTSIYDHYCRRHSGYRSLSELNGRVSKAYRIDQDNPKG